MAWRTSAPICCNIARTAMQVLKPELAWKYGAMSLGEYVRQQGYSQAFNRDYLLPMCAAVWSVPNAQVSPSCLLASFHSVDLRAGLPREAHSSVKRFLIISERRMHEIEKAAHTGDGVSGGDAGALLGEPPPAGPESAPRMARRQGQEPHVRPEDPGRCVLVSCSSLEESPLSSHAYPICRRQSFQ